MNDNWITCPSDVKRLVLLLQNRIKEILNEDRLGLYIHGSLAMGGFNPKSSDIDILVVIERAMHVSEKRELAQLFLKYSSNPFPIEISFLHTERLKNWKHPCPFDFHYSEFWRERYERDLVNGTYNYIHEDIDTDSDLAAHIKIMKHRGICVEGAPIAEVFPDIPISDYISSILGDYQDCLENVEEDPIYCALNLIRVYWYLKEGIISSKQEAGNWAMNTFPEELTYTVRKVTDTYNTSSDRYLFNRSELQSLKLFISRNVEKLLRQREDTFLFHE